MHLISKSGVRKVWTSIAMSAMVFAGDMAASAAAPQTKGHSLPPAVAQALTAKFPQAEITKQTKEMENGKVIYDIEFTQNGRKAEADIAEDGAIQNFEREFDAAKLPQTVTAAVEQRYPKAKLKEVMECIEIKDGKETPAGFETVLQTADKKDVELTLDHKGNILEDSGAK